VLLGFVGAVAAMAGGTACDDTSGPDACRNVLMVCEWNAVTQAYDRNCQVVNRDGSPSACDAGPPPDGSVGPR
jgi:hypothetical protein